jgi:hypothetical protein
MWTSYSNRVKFGGGVAERSDTAYVTPIEAIFDDMKEVIGAPEVVLLGTALGRSEFQDIAYTSMVNFHCVRR